MTFEQLVANLVTAFQSFFSGILDLFFKAATVLTGRGILLLIFTVGCFPTTTDVKQIVDDQLVVHEAHDSGMNTGFLTIADAVNANTADIAAAREASKAATASARESNASREGEVMGIFRLIEETTGLPPFMQTILAMFGIATQFRSRGSKKTTDLQDDRIAKLENGGPTPPTT